MAAATDGKYNYSSHLYMVKFIDISDCVTIEYIVHLPINLQTKMSQFHFLKFYNDSIHSVKLFLNIIYIISSPCSIFCVILFFFSHFISYILIQNMSHLFKLSNIYLFSQYCYSFSTFVKHFPMLLWFQYVCSIHLPHERNISYININKINLLQCLIP